MTALIVGILKRISKRYQNSVLWASSEQFTNSKTIHNTLQGATIPQREVILDFSTLRGTKPQNLTPVSQLYGSPPTPRKEIYAHSKNFFSMGPENQKENNKISLKRFSRSRKKIPSHCTFCGKQFMLLLCIAAYRHVIIYFIFYDGRGKCYN